MSYPVNQRINPSSTQPSMGVNAAQLQNVDADTVKQGITQNSVLKGVGDSEEKNKWVTPALTLPVWWAMAAAMSKFNDKCHGEYDKSWVGKVGNWGEKIGNSSFFKSSFMQKIGSALDSAKAWSRTHIINNSKILTAIFDTPTKPTNKMALMMSSGTPAEIASDAISKFELYIKEGNTLTYQGKPFTAEDIKELSENSHTEKGIAKIIAICEEQVKKGKDAIKIEKGGKIWFSKKITGEDKYISELASSTKKFFCGTKYFSEYTNKLSSFTKGKTWFGKALPKAMLRVIEGITNGTAGGKWAVLMAAYFVADAIKKTIDAPKGEKTSTFAENNIYNLGWYLTMPLGLNIMHRAGGLKYIGASKEQVAKFRTELEKYNKMAENGEFATNDAAKAAKKAVKNILKDTTEVKGIGPKVLRFAKNIIHKPLTWAANVLTVGLDAFRPYISKETKEFGKFMKLIPYRFKFGAGYPMRFIVFMFCIGPPLAKIGAKISHIIFGRPTKSVLDEGDSKKEEPKAQPAGQLAPPVMPQQKAPAQPQPASVMQPVQQKQNNLVNNQMVLGPRQNLLDMYKTSPQIPKSMVTTPQEPVRTYVPSSEGVKLQPDSEQNKQNDKLTGAMNKATMAEKQANRFLMK